MPSESIPSCRLHKASGQARMIIDGRHIYLGKYNSPETSELCLNSAGDVACQVPRRIKAGYHPPGIPTTGFRSSRQVS